jgi:hypothetical protein
MNSKLSRAILALLIGISFPIFTSTQVVSAAPAVSGVLGDSCVTQYISRVIATDSTGATEIAGVCFPSINNPDVFIWSKDNNPIPAYTLVADNDGKIAFGRSCVIAGGNTCSIPNPKTNGYLAAEPFIKAYPDTDHVDTLGGIWWSQTYYSNIIGANYLAPEAIAAIEDTTQVGGPISSQVVSSTLLIGLAAAVSLTSAAGQSSSQQTPSRSESPDSPELLRARKERRFAHANRFGRLFLGSKTSMDRWAFFTEKLPTLIRRIGKYSSTAATSVGDADYLRAVLGIFSMLMYPAAVLIGVFMSINSEKNVPIPTLIWIAAALILGCFDSLAGAITAITFFIATVTTNRESIPEEKWRYLATIIMIFVITTGPGLFAGALRRFDGVHTHRSGKWERLVDYALSPIVTAWVVWKALELTQTVSGADFSANTKYIKYVAAIVFACIFVRYLLEGYVAKHFADRINEIVAESVPIHKFHKIRVHTFKAAWITLIAYVVLVRVSGLTDNKSIWVLGFLLLLPALVLAFGIKPIDKISKFNITGTPRLAILLCAGLILIAKPGAKGVQFMTIAFTPVLYFILMEALAGSNLKMPAYFYQTRMGRFLYRFSSFLLYILILGIMLDQFFELEKISKFLS